MFEACGDEQQTLGFMADEYPLEVLNDGDADCAVRSDCTPVGTAGECFAEAQAQGIGNGGYYYIRERSDSQPGCFLYAGSLVEFNSVVVENQKAWTDIAPICRCSGEGHEGFAPGAGTIPFGLGGFPVCFILGGFFIVWNLGVGSFFVRPMAEYVRSRDRSHLCKALLSCLIPHVCAGIAFPGIVGGVVGFIMGVLIPCERCAAAAGPALR